MKHRNDLRQIHTRFFNSPPPNQFYNDPDKFLHGLTNKKPSQLPGTILHDTKRDGQFIGSLRDTYGHRRVKKS